MEKERKKRKVLLLFLPALFLIFYTKISEKAATASVAFGYEDYLELAERAKSILEKIEVNPYEIKRVLTFVALYDLNEDWIEIRKVRIRNKYHNFKTKNSGRERISIVHEIGYIAIAAKRFKRMPDGEIKETILVAPYSSDKIYKKIKPNDENTEQNSEEDSNNNNNDYDSNNDIKDDNIKPENNAEIKSEPETELEGLSYFKNILNGAKNELSDLKVNSRVFKKQFAGENDVYLDTALMTSIIEHVGHRELRDGKYNQFVKSVQFTLKEKGGLYNIVSPDGARGRFQIMPSTYRFIYKKFPKANIIRDFREGIRDINNAAKVALCLMDYNLSVLLREHPKFLRNNEEIVPLLLTASYNCGVHGVSRLISKYGYNWDRHLSYQTKMYLLKYNEVYKFLYSPDNLKGKSFES